MNTLCEWLLLQKLPFGAFLWLGLRLDGSVEIFQRFQLTQITPLSLCKAFQEFRYCQLYKHVGLWLRFVYFYLGVLLPTWICLGRCEQESIWRGHDLTLISKSQDTIVFQTSNSIPSPWKVPPPSFHWSQTALRSGVKSSRCELGDVPHPTS